MPLTGGPLLPKVAPSQTKIASLNFKDQYVCSSPALYPRAAYNFADPPPVQTRLTDMRVRT